MGTALHGMACSVPLLQGPRRQRRCKCTPVRQGSILPESILATAWHTRPGIVTLHACMSTRAAKRAKGPKTSAPPSGGSKKSSGGLPVSYKSPGKVSEGCGPALACTNHLAETRLGC